MKTNTPFLPCAFLSILFLVPLLLSSGCDQSSDAPLALDPEVRSGRFDNGLTYFVRSNAMPRARLDLRLAVKAGSVLEDDDQQGLAHLLEHMAFNGTRHFDRQQLVDYLESIGMRFGPELNAYTTFDQTVYRLQVPATDPAMVEKGLQILEDWAFGIRNDEEEIQKERGVVIEEWRLGRGAAQRIRDRQFPVLFHGSRYAVRLPIGKKEVLETFPSDRLRSFYRDWYRPDLMAVIAVGDMDPRAMEDLIRRRFSAQPPPTNPRERPTPPVPPHADTLVSVASDKEATHSSVNLVFKRTLTPAVSVQTYRRQLVESLALAMLNARIDERQREANPPFLAAGAGRWRLGLAHEAFVLDARVKDNGFIPGLEAIFTEARRATLHGVTPTELDRARRDVLSHSEKAFNERHTTESSSHAETCIRAFLHGDIPPGVAAELELQRRLLPGIGPAEIQTVYSGWLSPSNRVILASGPDKPDVTMPAPSDLLAALARVDAAAITPYADDVSGDSLIEALPPDGSICARRELDDIGVTVWTLSNGATVILKPTSFKKDQVLFSAFAPGGHSRVEDADFIPAISADSIRSESGWGRFSENQLRKKLAGQVVSMQPYISELRQGLRGSARPEDLETAFQLAHLAFTAPRHDDDAFAAYQDRMRTHILNRLARPEEVFSDEIQLALYSNHPRRQPWTLDSLKRLDPARSLDIYRQRFRSAAGFVFFLVGSLEPARVEPLVIRYLASLPSAPDTPETWVDRGVRPAKGRLDRTVRKGQDPKSRVTIFFSGPFKWSFPERFRLKAMIDVLNIRLRERIREEIGGTYSIWAGSTVERHPEGEYQIRIGFGCAPEQVDALIKAVHAELDRIKTRPMEDIYLVKVRQTLLREREVQLERNEFWQFVLEFSQWNGDDPRTAIQDFTPLVEALTAGEIQKTAATYFSTPNVATFVLKPGEPEPAP